MSVEQPESFDAWIGRSEESADRLTHAPIHLLRATLDYADASELPAALPPLWHWLYFLPGERQSNIGVDGHPRRGGFLPPVALPRRMWAGGRLQFLRPLTVDAPVRRRSTITNVQSKSGRSGQLVFVTVLHEISDAQGVAIREEQDIDTATHHRPRRPAHRHRLHCPRRPTSNIRASSSPTRCC